MTGWITVEQTKSLLFDKRGLSKRIFNIVSTLQHCCRLCCFCSAFKVYTTSNASFCQSNIEQPDICPPLSVHLCGRQKWSPDDHTGWLPPDDSCAVCTSIRPDRQHLFPIILGKMRNWGDVRGSDLSHRVILYCLNQPNMPMFWDYRPKDHKSKGHLKNNVPNKKLEQCVLSWQSTSLQHLQRDGGKTDRGKKKDVYRSCV